MTTREPVSQGEPNLHSRSAWLVVCVTVTLSYLVPRLAALSTPNPEIFWPVWPGCAILVAGLLLVSLSVWPVLIVACFSVFALADLQAGESTRAVLLFIPGNTIEVLIAALGLRFAFGGVPQLNSVKALAKYSIVAVLLAPFASAFLNARGISADYWSGWRICFLSEVLAFVTITPAILSWVNNGPAFMRKPRKVHLEGVILLTALVLLSYVTFTYTENPVLPALLYSLVPLLLWSALRFGLVGISSSMVIVTSLSIWAALQGRGPFHQLLHLLNTVSLQLFLIFAAVPFMILAAVVEERQIAQQELRTDEEKLRLLLESAAEAIYGIDSEGRCTFCNPACLRLLGYTRSDELLGKDMHKLIQHGGSDKPVVLEEGSTFQAFQVEGRSDKVVLWRADGTKFPAEYWSQPQRIAGEVVGAVVGFTDITERKLSEEALASVSRKLIEAQEQERMRIARELHDDIAQRLALSSVELAQVQQSLKDETPANHQRIATLRERIADISTDVQTMSHQLHSSKLEYLGLAAAAKGFCREFAEQQKLKIDFESQNLPSRLPQEISLSLFRVLQEGLHNAAKHSRTTHFEVQLWGDAAGIHLTVMDPGAGFDVDGVNQRKGLGLTSMQERMKLVGGIFEIESRPLSGTKLHACVPLELEKSTYSHAS